MTLLIPWLLVGLMGWILRVIQTPEIEFAVEDAAMLPVCVVLGPISLIFVFSDIL